jgi:hypothetical protein
MHKAIESLEDILNQCNAILDEIKTICPIKSSHMQGHIQKHATNEDYSARQGATHATRLVYLQAHLEALQATLSVLLQTLYTAQGIIWAR